MILFYLILNLKIKLKNALNFKIGFYFIFFYVIYKLKMFYLLKNFFYLIIFDSIDTKKPSNLRAPNEQWSGEATRTSGFLVEDTRVDVTIGDESSEDNANHRKERPIWMMESTIINSDGLQVFVYCHIFP